MRLLRWGAFTVASVALVACSARADRAPITTGGTTPTAPPAHHWHPTGTTTTTTMTQPVVVAQEATRPAVVKQQVSSGSVEALIRKWFPSNWQRMGSIFWCESKWVPTAVSPGGGNHGIAQINNVHAGNFEAVTGRPWLTGRYEANANLAYARYLYDREGERPWSCARMV